MLLFDTVSNRYVFFIYRFFCSLCYLFRICLIVMLFFRLYLLVIIFPEAIIIVRFSAPDAL